MVDSIDVPERALQIGADAPLATLRRLLGRLIKHSHLPAEDVHQLRVSTRKSRAILEVFGHRIGKGRVRRLNRRLRKILREAGKVRDCDVLLERLRASASTHNDFPQRPLVGKLKRRRTLAMATLLVKASPGHLRRKLTRARRRMARIEPKRSTTALSASLDGGQFATVQAARRLHDAVASTISGSIERLHQVRIAAKKLRYLIDQGGSLPRTPHSTEIIAQLKATQDLLGSINDQANFLKFLLNAKLPKRPDRRRALAAVADEVGVRMAGLRAEFESQHRLPLLELAASIGGRPPVNKPTADNYVKREPQPVRPAV